jgi:hypothetical protein
MKKTAIILLICAVCLGSPLFYLCFTRIPPKEAKLVQHFQTHRAAFERLRDMLQADGQVVSLTGSGVPTTNSLFLRVPPEGNLTLERYNVYMALLKQVSGSSAYRRQGQHPDSGIVVWNWGWAGNSLWIGICWMDQAPTNLIATLDGYSGQDRFGQRHVAYRHIEANWYLCTDL